MNVKKKKQENEKRREVAHNIETHKKMFCG